MKKTLLCMAIAMLMGANAQASLLTNLSIDGNQDILANSATYGMAINFDSSIASNGANLGVGDVVFNITSVVNAAGNRVITISSLEVDTDNGLGLLSFKAVNGSATPVGNTINAAYAAGRGSSTDLFAGLNKSDLNLQNFTNALGFSVTVPTNAAFVVLSSTTAVDPNSIDVGGDASDLNGLDILRNPSNFGVANYQVDMIGGFYGSDFYEVQVVNPPAGALANLRKQAPTNSPTVTNPGGVTPFAFAAGGFTVLSHNLGGSTTFLPVSVTHTDGFTTTNHDVTLDPFTLATIKNFAGTTNDAAEEFMFSSSLTFNTNPNQVVPEPASMLIWSGLAVAGLVGYRRRKNA